MLRMMKLDWSATKYYRMRSLLIIPVCLLVAGWFSTIYLIPMGTFLLFSFSLNTFGVEEKSDLNNYSIISIYASIPSVLAASLRYFLHNRELDCSSFRFSVSGISPQSSKRSGMF